MIDDFSEVSLKRPESLAELIDDISPSIYHSLKSAIELGKWSDGTRLGKRQVEECMQAIILYEAENLPEQSRIGFGIPSECSKQKLSK